MKLLREGKIALSSSSKGVGEATMHSISVIGWAAVAPRDGGAGFSGSIQILTESGQKDLRRLSAFEFERCLAALQGRRQMFVDDEGKILLNADLETAPA